MTFGIDSPDWNTPVGISNGNYVYRVMTDNRKRPREEESCDFMPLSKRINNLHINNNLRSLSATPIPETNHHNGMSTESQPSSDNRQPSYDPGVNSSQSPYFFDNKLLFELHLQRIQRSGQQFPF